MRTSCNIFISKIWTYQWIYYYWYEVVTNILIDKQTLKNEITFTIWQVMERPCFLPRTLSHAADLLNVTFHLVAMVVSQVVRGIGLQKQVNCFNLRIKDKSSLVFILFVWSFSHQLFRWLLYLFICMFFRSLVSLFYLFIYLLIICLRISSFKLDSPFESTLQKMMLKECHIIKWFTSCHFALLREWLIVFF